MAFSLGALVSSSVWSVFRLRERIQMSPVYQRESDIWTLEKKQLLIDTIINGFDVPKIYMHKFTSQLPAPSHGLEYAVIDGKQRLSAIWDFIQGNIALSREFVYVRQEGVDLKGFTYADLSREFPDIKADFDSYHLSVVTIETDEIELVEDMFSRLNEAMPLNAAEKRNARPGPLPEAVRQLCDNGFFTDKIPFTNRRYRHFDIGAKMLYLASREAIADTKKAYIDKFFDAHRSSQPADIDRFVMKANEIVDAMASIFVDKDPLLRSVGMISLYYLLFERAIDKGKVALITRSILEEFENMRVENRTRAEVDIAEADYNLLEFDRYTQSPNDAIAMRFRLSVVDKLLFNEELGFELPD
ncbi:MAG: hypothetical protein C0491_05740 [Novosphingobium sp.]|nr:hypothetical protein [Novosphingobium sp.]